MANLFLGELEGEFKIEKMKILKRLLM